MNKTGARIMEGRWGGRTGFRIMEGWWGGRLYSPHM